MSSRFTTAQSRECTLLTGMQSNSSSLTIANGPLLHRTLVRLSLIGLRTKERDMVLLRTRPLSFLPLRPRKPPSTLTSFLTPVLSRNAHHAAEGRANGAKDGPGKRLGAKKGATELVVPGNIIFRQRGTEWFPGENCDIGRDHTIFATAKGYVTFYSDPERHPHRKYIGVVFERGMKLPTPRNAARKRRLGMVAREMSTSTPTLEAPKSHAVTEDLVNVDGKAPQMMDQPKQIRSEVPAGKAPVIKPGYMFRESNSYIGRAAERAGVKYRKFDHRDRFAVWRRRTAQIQEERERRGIKNRITGSQRRKIKNS